MEMKRYIVLPLALLSMSWASWGQPAGYSPYLAIDSLAQALQVRNAELHRIAADFVQEEHSPLLAEVGRSSGRFYLQVERGVYFDYQQPEESKLIAYSDSVLILAGGERQVIRFGGRGRGNPMGQMLELTLLRDLGKLKGRYALDVYRGNAGYLIVLRPRRREVVKLIEKISIYLRAEDLAVSRIELSLPGGSRTSYEFTNQQFNLQLPEWPQ